MSKPKIISLATMHIIADDGAQFRQETNLETVAEYAEAMRNGDDFPPAVVYYDGSKNWLSDGFTRYLAAIEAKKKLLCEVRSGGRRDAKMNALGANDGHGQRLTRKDKRKKVERIFTDPEINVDPETGVTWSDSEIARLCRVSRDLVADIRKELSCGIPQDRGARKVVRGGTVYEQSTANIGSKKPNEADEPNEDTEESDGLNPSSSTPLSEGETPSNSTELEPAPEPDDEPQNDPFEDEPDDGEPDFSMPPAAPGTEEEWNHPFADVDAEDDEPEQESTAPSPIEFLVGDEVAGTTRKGDAILGIISDIFPADEDGRGVVFVKGDTNGACFTDRLSLATGRYLGGLMGLEPGHLVAWEWEGKTVYGRYIEHSNDGRIGVADFFDPSKQYEPKAKDLDVRRWTSEDRKNALTQRDNRSAALDEHETPVAQPEPKLSVEEQIAALPLAQALALYKHGGHLFRQNAALYFNWQKLFKAAHAKLDTVRHMSGPVPEICATFAKVSHPSEWEGCASCKGSGRVGERADPCGRCKGGFTIHKGEGVSPDVVRTFAESL